MKKIRLEKVRKPFWGSQLFKWAENSRGNRSLTHKKFILLLNRERLGISEWRGNHVERWLGRRYELMVKGEVR